MAVCSYNELSIGKQLLSEIVARDMKPFIIGIIEMQNKTICNWDTAGWKSLLFRKDGINIKDGSIVLYTHKKDW